MSIWTGTFTLVTLVTVVVCILPPYMIKGEGSWRKKSIIKKREKKRLPWSHQLEKKVYYKNKKINTKSKASGEGGKKMALP